MLFHYTLVIGKMNGSYKKALVIFGGYEFSTMIEYERTTLVPF